MDPPPGNIYSSKRPLEPSSYDPNINDFHAHIIYSLLDSPQAKTLCDVSFQTSDGHEVPVCRALLASHSDYFRTMFFSEFEESSQKTINVDMSKQVLRYVLIFAYTGQCYLADVTLKCLTIEEISAKHEELKLLVQLSSAADYCSLSLLRSWCDSSLISICERFPFVTCTVLAAMKCDAAHQSSREKLHGVIRKYYKTALNVPEGFGKRSYTEIAELATRRRKLNLQPLQGELNFNEEQNPFSPAFPPEEPYAPSTGTYEYGRNPIELHGQYRNPIEPRYSAYAPHFSVGGRGQDDVLQGLGHAHTAYGRRYRFPTVPILRNWNGTRPDPKTYGIVALPPEDVSQVIFNIQGRVCHEYLVQCIFYWVTKGTVLSRKHCKLRAREGVATNGERGKEVCETPHPENEDGICFVDRDRFEWGKKLAAELNPKLMRIRFVHDYAFQTGLLEGIDMDALLRDHMFCSTHIINEV